LGESRRSKENVMLLLLLLLDASEDRRRRRCCCLEGWCWWLIIMDDELAILCTHMHAWMHAHNDFVNEYSNGVSQLSQLSQCCCCCYSSERLFDYLIIEIQKLWSSVPWLVDELYSCGVVFVFHSTLHRSRNICMAI
jgi:hypothetical protein